MKKSVKRSKLRELRNDRSLLTVATDLGITRQMLGAIEIGDRNPSLKLAQKIADYYNVSIEEIFFDNNRNDLLPNLNDYNQTGTAG